MFDYFGRNDGKRRSTFCRRASRSFAARRLADKKEPFSEFLLDLLPPEIQTSLRSTLPSAPETLRKLQKGISDELGRLIRTTSFYDSRRFERSELSPEALVLNGRQDNYKIAQLNRVLLHDSFSSRAVTPRDEIA